MDVFSTQSFQSAQFILDLFSGGNLFYDVMGYNASALNASQTLINQSLENGTQVEPGYLFSKLTSSSRLLKTTPVM